VRPFSVDESLETQWLEGPEKEDGGKMSCRVCLAKIRDTAPLQSEIGSGGIKCGLACSTGEELG
jgi:hypothetical protein